MVFPSDEEILSWKSNACPDSWKTHLFKPMNARQLLGHFLSLRADCYGSRKLYCHAVVDLNNALLLYPKNPAMTRNLIACLQRQYADPEYANNEELRSLRPRMPAWNGLPN